MSRSRRRRPIFGITKSRSEKLYKRLENRAKRKAVRRSVKCGDELQPHDKEYGNPWSGPKDGKTYWKRATKKDMRK